MSGETVEAAAGHSPWRRRILITLAIVITAIVIHRLIAHHKMAQTGEPPQSVQVKAVFTGDMPETLFALGTVTPTATVTVVPQLSGYLTAVGFTEGEDVAQGQFLAQIDPRPYEVQLQQSQAALAKDEAGLAQARSDLARYMRLGRQNSIAEQQITDQEFLVQQDEAAVEGDQANIASAKLDLTYCHITAPVAGRIGLRLIDPGNYVTSSSSTGIAVITSIKPITVIFTIPQDDLAEIVSRFSSGAKLPVTAYSSDNTTKIATGSLAAISNQMSATTGTIELRATFTNDNEALFPDEFVNTSLLVKTLKGVTLVPSSAVQSGSPGAYVYVVKANDMVAMQPVTTGPSDGVDTVIEKGLSPGELVVTDGVDRLTDGTKVVVVPMDDSASSASRQSTAAGNSP